LKKNNDGAGIYKNYKLQIETILKNMKINIWKIGTLLLLGIFLLVGGVLLGKFLSNGNNNASTSNQTQNLSKNTNTKQNLSDLDTKKVSGEVFIVTKGSDNVKLGLINVIAVPEEIFESNLKAREIDIKAKIEKAKNSANDCTNKVNAFYEGKYKGDVSSMMSNCGTIFQEVKDLPNLLMDSLPKEVFSTVTNADGKFSFNLPSNGKYTILAKGKRTVGDSEEKYYWLETVDTSKDNQTIILSNNNLVEVTHMRVLFKVF